MAVTTEEIWTGFRSKLLTYIRARSRNSHDAEDILQEVFLKVHRRVGSLQDDNHVAAWLYRVTHNTIVDYYRKMRPTPTDVDPIAVSEDDIPVAERSLAPFLADLVADLPAIYAEALTLTELEELTQTDMARRLGLSISGAKSRVQRGRAMLRDQLLACCEVELDCQGHVVDYESRAAQPWPEDCSCAPETTERPR